MSLIKLYRDRVADRTDSEHSQALLRIFVISCTTVYSFLTQSDSLRATQIAPYMFIVSLAIFAHIMYRPESLIWRRLAGTTHDVLATTFAIFLSPQYGCIFLFLYPFITVGNGFRYGVKSLLISGLFGFSGIAFLMFANPHWANEPIIGVGVLISYILVTAYTASLLKKLNQVKDKLEKLATHDSLTSLANRSLFMQRLAHSMQFSLRHKQGAACVYFDLDGFKAVNDTYGHKIGDELLKAVSKKAKESIRATDLLARLGGDEFAVILDSVKSDEEVKMVATRMIQAIESIKELRGNPIKISCSIGIAFIAPGRPFGTEVCIEELIKTADLAMYRAKKAGKGRFEFVDFVVPTVAAA